jgi:hypothetical protein
MRINRFVAGLAAVAGFVLLAAGQLCAQPKPPVIEPAKPQWMPPPAPQPPPRPNQPTFVPSFLPIIFVLLAVILLAQQRRQQEEEEEVSTHLSDASTGFEYKIIRSATGAFKTPEKFRAILDEEARAGWELFEKLDDCRVRLRRQVSFRERDADLGQDPYRTRIAGGEGKVALTIVLIVLGVIVGIAAVVGVIALITNK